MLKSRLVSRELQKQLGNNLLAFGLVRKWRRLKTFGPILSSHLRWGMAWFQNQNRKSRKINKQTCDVICLNGAKFWATLFFDPKTFFLTLPFF